MCAQVIGTETAVNLDKIASMTCWEEFCSAAHVEKSTTRSEVKVMDMYRA